MNNRLKERFSQIDVYTILVGLLIVVGFILRVYQVDYLTLWVDEYVHVDRARFFPTEKLFTNDNNGILLTMFIIPFFKIFGVSEFWARFPSVLLGTLMIPLLFQFGKKFFNKNVGLIAAALVTFSQYMVFWSRISRNYMIFSFFFLLFLYFLAKSFHIDDHFKGVKNKIFNYLKVEPKYFIITLCLFFLAILSHQLAFLVIYGICFYHFVIFLYRIIKRKADFLSINAILAYAFVIFLMAIFIPAIQGFLRSILVIFLPEKITYWVLPDMSRLSVLMKTQPYHTFNIYWDVLKFDFNSIYYLGILGFVISVYKYKKAGVFIASIFISLFLLMSFVFREPSLPRYLIYIYPLFLISIAISFDTILSYVVALFRKMKLVKQIKSIQVSVAIVSLIIILLLPTTKSSFAMVRNKNHGRVIANELSNFYFPDWKTSMKKIKPYVQEDDILISTMPSYANFYLGRTSYHFRQRYYDTQKHAYQNFEIDTLSPNARSTVALRKLLHNTDRAWLIADYYFNNVMTDPQTRNFVIQNMTFQYDMSNNYISVFLWDKNRPSQNRASLFEYLHDDYPVSQEYAMNMDQLQPGSYVIRIDMEGITYDNELVLHINGKNYGVLKRYGEQADKNSKIRQYYYIPLPNNALKAGRNTIRFLYNKNRIYKNASFAIYNFDIAVR